MRKYINPFLLGSIITLVLLVFMTQVTMNFQVILIMGCLFYAAAGRILARGVLNSWLSAFLIVSSFTVVFLILVVPQIPGFYYFPVLFYFSAAAGSYMDKKLRSTVIIIPMIAVLAVVTIWVVPSNLKEALTRSLDKDIPVFELTNLSGETINSEGLKDKVVILDFFGTWCKPCIEELETLTHVKKNIETYDDVLFLVVNADLGGDTPEKFSAFIDSKDYNFDYYYDHQSTVYDALGYTGSGLPVLLVIDKNGRLRYQHIGFNSAETGFGDHLYETVLSLR